MNNKFINYNGVNLLNTSKKQNKKTKVESRIDELKKQKQKIITELWSWEIKQKKADKLLNYLDEVERFGTKYLAEVVKVEKEKENCDYYWLEHLLKNKISFALKFEPAKEAFTELVFKKIENRVRHLKSQLDTIQRQLTHQERIFARIGVRRQGRELLTCEYKNRLGCFGDDQCDNCQINYSVVADNNQITEISQ